MGFAILTLWDRQEFASARESIVRAVVTNLHLLDLHMQVGMPLMLFIINIHEFEIRLIVIPSMLMLMVLVVVC